MRNAGLVWDRRYLDHIAGPGHPESWETARLAVGGLFSGLDAIVGAEVDSVFALVRPPGHHAEADRAMGFCLFNNVALGAHYARHVLGYERVLIVDWDLHHGNGTQHSFYRDPGVLYISTHQYPYYPGSGGIEEIGEGEGRGFTINVPLPPGADDKTYTAIYTKLVPLAEAFSPGLILVSAGFDIGKNDPLGGMAVSTEGFAALANILLSLADSCCEGKILFSLEGGYDLPGLRDGVIAVLGACNHPSPPRTSSPGPELHGIWKRVIDRVLDVHRDFWPI